MAIVKGILKSDVEIRLKPVFATWKRKNISIRRFC
jgi:hypothetical protein